MLSKVDLKINTYSVFIKCTQ